MPHYMHPGCPQFWGDLSCTIGVCVKGSPCWSSMPFFHSPPSMFCLFLFRSHQPKMTFTDYLLYASYFKHVLSFHLLSNSIKYAFLSLCHKKEAEAKKPCNFTQQVRSRVLSLGFQRPHSAQHYGITRSISAFYSIYAILKIKHFLKYFKQFCILQPTVKMLNIIFMSLKMT